MKQKIILFLLVVLLPLQVNASQQLSAATLGRQLQLDHSQQRQLEDVLLSQRTQTESLEERYALMAERLQVELEARRQQLHEDQLRELATILSADQVCRYESLMLMASGGQKNGVGQRAVVEQPQQEETPSKSGWTVSFGGHPEKSKEQRDWRGVMN